MKVGLLLMMWILKIKFINQRWLPLIISKKKIKDVLKMTKSLEEFSLLIKSVDETIANEAKE